jgi:hypothetical protein
VTKADPSSSLSPFQRFEKLGKALFAVPKTEVDAKAVEHRRKRGKRRTSKKIA